MNNNDGSTQGAVWPLPKFYFHVSLGDLGMVAFQQVSGLETETQTIEYRHGDSPAFSTIKMPGLAKVGNVTLSKGVFTNDNKFWSWYNQIKLNTIKRQTVVVSLLDEKGSPTMVWTLNNAFPTKITSTELNSEGNEIAVESLEIAFETLTITNG